MINKVVINTLRSIASKSGGLLRPVDIVEAARPATSPLHDRFTWDDTAAAHEYRLIEARKLIQVTVHVLAGSTVNSRVWVSMRDDRANDGGGYRPLVNVLSKQSLRDQFLAEALDELRYFQEKYQDLKELAGVIAAIKKVA